MGPQHQGLEWIINGSGVQRAGRCPGSECAPSLPCDGDPDGLLWVHRDSLCLAAGSSPGEAAVVPGYKGTFRAFAPRIVKSKMSTGIDP